jgi:hypothetical protein
MKFIVIESGSLKSHKRAVDYGRKCSPYVTFPAIETFTHIRFDELYKTNSNGYHFSVLWHEK